MKIALLGDIALFGRYCLRKNPNVLSHFDAVRNFLGDYDVIVGNLETPFSDSERPAGWKSAHIRSHPANADLLKYLGVTHVTLANNHVADYGRRAYERTKSILDQAGIGWFGAEGKQIHIEQKGEKIALLGYCSLTTNPSTVSSGTDSIPNILDIDDVVCEMTENARRGFLNVLAIHSGQEHVHMPSSEDVAFARRLAARFDYVYYGHHPHVVQGAEQVGMSPIFYSLGNFVFDDVYTPRDENEPLIRLSEANKTGAIASLTVHNGEVRDWRLTPLYLRSDEMLIGGKVPCFRIDEYNALLLNAGSQEYESKRRDSIASYIGSRRARRNLKWYLKRLNMNSIGIILSARSNARRHHFSFSSKLGRLW